VFLTFDRVVVAGSVVGMIRGQTTAIDDLVSAMLWQAIQSLLPIPAR
jgi:hypothetical protein